MKKLLFATAIAASAAAFADPITAVAFEGDNDYQPNVSGSRFYFDGESNSSFVSNDVNAASTTKRTAYYKEANNAKYLALDTEGGTLWRSINEINTTDGYSLGTAENVAATGTYLDTLVQFTVTEDEAPEVGAEDKLAIWLGVVTNAQGEVTGTNLMVKAKAIIDDNGSLDDATFELDATVAPGQWYRLTVKALADITDDQGIPGFQIYLDGGTTPLSAKTAVINSDFLEFLESDSHYADLAANRSFPSRSTATTLKGVGFQGTGAVDEIVWTEDNPFPAAPTAVDFTLSWTAGQVAAVSYTIDGTTTAINDLTTGTTTIQVDPGTEVTVAATAAAWYEISSGTGAVTVASAAANAIVTELAATPSAAGATGLPASVSTADAKEWADAKSITPAQIAASTFAEKAYLLNTDLSVEPTFEIAQIEEVKATGQEEGYWKITVQAKAGDTTLDLENINGTLKVKTGATLEALGSATSTVISASDLSFDAEGKAVIAIKGTGKNFIRATVE